MVWSLGELELWARVSGLRFRMWCPRRSRFVSLGSSGFLPFQHPKGSGFRDLLRRGWGLAVTSEGVRAQDLGSLLLLLLLLLLVLPMLLPL